MDVTEQALHEGIAQALPGNRVADISRAIQNYVEGNGFSVVREFVGHGVGRSMHEEPQVPNFVDGQVVAQVAAGHDPGHRADGQRRVGRGKNFERWLDSGDARWFTIRSF